MCSYKTFLYYQLWNDAERNVKALAGVESVIEHLPNMQEISICSPAQEERDKNQNRRKGRRGSGGEGRRGGGREKGRQVKGEEREGGGRRQEEEELNKYRYIMFRF